MNMGPSYLTETKSSKYGRGSPLWIVGRIGILVVFGIMPLTRISHHAHTSYDFQKWDKFYEYSAQFDAAASNEDIPAMTLWLDKMHAERIRIEGTNQP